MEENKDLSPEDQEIKEKEQKNKVKNAFDQNIAKLSAILNKEPDKKGRKRVPANSVDALVKELFKEDGEKAEKEFKEELRTLLDNYVALWKAIDDKKREIEKLENDKMKEFNEKASKIFNKVEGLPELQKKYAEGLRKAAQAGNPL